MQSTFLACSLLGTTRSQTLYHDGEEHDEIKAGVVGSKPSARR